MLTALPASRPDRRWLVVGITCIAAFIGQLDASIVQLALPSLKNAFDSSVNAVRWVAIAYLLAFAACLPIFGRLCEMYGRKRLYLIGFAIFTAASLLCGLAPSLDWLIAFRILQGIGGAMLGANSISILVTSVDPQMRGRAISVFTAAQAVGVSAGPIVGGVVLDALGWRWIFWASVPFGLAAALLGWLVLERDEPPRGDRRFDWAGALLLTPSLVLIILALNQISEWPLLSWKMLSCVAAAVLLLGLFVRHERSSKYPLIPTGLFARRAYAGGMVGVGLGYALLYGMFFLMSFALIHGFHESARSAGLKLAVIPIAIGLTAPLSPMLAACLGRRSATAVGMVLCCAAILGLSAIALKHDGLLTEGLAAFAVFGIGLGLFVALSNHSTLDAAPSHRTSEAGAMLTLVRVFGSCIGVSSASSMMSWRMEAAAAGNEAVFFVGRPLLAAVESTLVMLALFGAIAGCLTLISASKAP